MIFKNKNTFYIQCFFVEIFCHLWQIQLLCEGFSQFSIIKFETITNIWWSTPPWTIKKMFCICHHHSQFHTILGCRMPPQPITFIHTSLPLKILAITNINVSLDLYIAHSYVNLHLYIIFIKKVSFYMGLV